MPVQIEKLLGGNGLMIENNFNDHPVRFEVDGNVAIVTLNRPDKANAFDGAMWLALEEAAEKIILNDSVRVVLITGAGKSFCGGLDINLAATEGINLGKKTMRDGFDTLRYLSGVFSMYEKLPVPVIAVIKGGCIGLGLELALACDIRLASDSAVFSIPEVAFGLVPDCGGTQRLPRLIGPAMAKELIFTGRRIDSREALRIGLVNHIYPAGDLDNEVAKMAAEMAGQAPAVVQASKRCINKAMNTTLEAGLDFETSAAESVLGEKTKTIIKHNRRS